MAYTGSALQAVVETPEYFVAARRILTDTERGALVDFLAANPTAGDLMPGTGGVRKLRWAARAKGKKRRRAGNRLFRRPRSASVLDGDFRQGRKGKSFPSRTQRAAGYSGACSGGISKGSKTACLNRVRASCGGRGRRWTMLVALAKVSWRMYRKRSMWRPFASAWVFRKANLRPSSVLNSMPYRTGSKAAAVLTVLRAPSCV